MKKIYNSPMLQVVMFCANDIITSSDVISGNEVSGAGVGGLESPEDGDALAPTRGGRF